MKNVIKEQIDIDKSLIDEIIYLIQNNDDIIKDLTIKLSSAEAEQDDLLHEVELAKLNAFEKQKVFDKLKDVREKRRIIKDKLQIFNTLKPIANLMITKGMLSEMKQTIKNLETLEKTIETRRYTAKIRNDLKCAKE